MGRYWGEVGNCGGRYRAEGAGAAVASKGAVRAAAEGRAAEGREAGVERRRRRGRDNEQGVWHCYGAASGGRLLRLDAGGDGSLDKLAEAREHAGEARVENIFELAAALDDLALVLRGGETTGRSRASTAAPTRVAAPSRAEKTEVCRAQRAGEGRGAASKRGGGESERRAAVVRDNGRRSPRMARGRVWWKETQRRNCRHSRIVSEAARRQWGESGPGR